LIRSDNRKCYENTEQNRRSSAQTGKYDAQVLRVSRDTLTNDPIDKNAQAVESNEHDDGPGERWQSVDYSFNHVLLRLPKLLNR